MTSRWLILIFQNPQHLCSKQTSCLKHQVPLCLHTFFSLPFLFLKSLWLFLRCKPFNHPSRSHSGITSCVTFSLLHRQVVVSTSGLLTLGCRTYRWVSYFSHIFVSWSSRGCFPTPASDSPQTLIGCPTIWLKSDTVSRQKRVRSHREGLSPTRRPLLPITLIERGH